jgi:hypothetical protein
MATSEPDLRALHAEHLAGAKVKTLAARIGRKNTSLLIAWARLGLAQIHHRKPRSHAVADTALEAMHAAWMAGDSLQSIERRHGRPAESLRIMFAARGWSLKPPANRYQIRRANGCFLPADEPTQAEIDAAVASAPKFMIPPALARAWKHWNGAKRGSVIVALRDRFDDPRDQPKTPFSRNLIPFDYTTPAAWKIVRAANAGLSSRQWRCHLKITSQGVIWDHRLWFWSRRTACYQEGIPWTPEHGRPVLSRAVWEAAFKAPVPAGCVVRCKDGNPNNLAPSNLYVCTRNELVRANQAAALNKRSRAIVSNLLSSTNQPTNQPHVIRSISLQNRARRVQS